MKNDVALKINKALTDAIQEKAVSAHLIWHPDNELSCHWQNNGRIQELCTHFEQGGVHTLEDTPALHFALFFCSSSVSECAYFG